ncbi:MAG: phosphate-starvation-inducible rane protein PsiE [Acidimicrobiales bacterium]|nr:phosphate-starvation-inducible rane protein PsiE [Acidimicrobiales bacterium]
MADDGLTGGGRSTSHHREVLPGAAMRIFAVIENVIYVLVAGVLIGLAAVLLYRTVVDAVTSDQPFSSTITTAVNGVLFVVIVLEIYRTVVAHLEDGGFQLRPFLVIGIISAVRHILLIGAQSLASETTTSFARSQIELGVNAGVALGLVIALVLLHRSGVTAASADPD